jgi:hypothetical protein
MSPHESIAASDENRKYIESLIDTKLAGFRLELEQQRTKVWIRVYWAIVGAIGLGGWTFLIWSLASE